ncbi:MAG: hypothetical protein QOG06_1959 [Gaiellaceae bacterium]|jgi:hypothetical protein|nr:hypothetical protein [Gaiellaceae bacterium]
MRLFAVAAVALALAAPATAAPKLSKADRAAISRSIDVFVNHAVRRVGTTAAYDVVAPELRPGINRKEWARGDIPVYPFPAAGRTHPWNVLYVTREEVGLELELIPKAHSDVGPIIFHIYLRPAHGRWLVDSFMPVATLAPLGSKKSKVRSVRDFSPQAAGGVSLGGGSHGQISRVYILIPFVGIGLVLLGLAAWGTTRAVRNRRLRGPRGGSLPPLPRSDA